MSILKTHIFVTVNGSIDATCVRVFAHIYAFVLYMYMYLHVLQRGYSEC